MLRKVNIRTAIQSACQDVIQEAKVDLNYVIRHLMLIIEGNMFDFLVFDQSKHPSVNLAGVPREKMYALKACRHSRRTQKSTHRGQRRATNSSTWYLQMENKLAALELLCRLTGLLNDQGTKISAKFERRVIVTTARAGSTPER